MHAGSAPPQGGAARSARRLGAWAAALGAVVTANAFFLAFAFGSALLPREPIAVHVRHAFDDQELIDADYLRYDARRGFHQYGDCVILQMMTNRHFSLSGRAIGPRLYVTDDSYSEICRTLRHLVVDRQNPAGLRLERYSRYWHGPLTAAAPLLMVLELSWLRFLLRAVVCTSALLVLYAGITRRRFLPLAGSVAAAALGFWALPYFGQGLSHAFGDAAVLFGIAGLMIGHDVLHRRTPLFVYCAVYGAVVVYFDMLTGAIPTAAGLLVPTAYVVGRTNRIEPSRALRMAVGGAAAFAAGGIVTVAVRLASAWLMVEPSGIDVFASNLQLYAEGESATGGMMARLTPIAQLWQFADLLTYRNEAARTLLGWSTVIVAAGSAAISLGARRMESPRTDLAAFALGASAIPAWCFLLPTHTQIHAEFMTRILIVPLALGWASLAWFVMEMRRSKQPDQTAPPHACATTL